ncbi:hypothetical protein CYY_005389 [Polysphondylium violaceum]|uniref:WD repeat-containing protein 75 second beta-propeller domain-containing protein n=1 Tax=Polysphondylium violaceum TaxID=133409 RepID=A0A8J4UYP2_9MYCE|nr:hypothetical protein CYY_005389 [Polysphondylium violaceum]
MHKTTQTIEWKDMGIQSGGSLVAIKPLFLESNKLITVSGCMIKIYNTQSGELRAEESISNQERFSSMYWENGSKIVYLSTKEGNIYLYNHTTYKVEQCIKLKIAINRLLVRDNNIYILNDNGVYSATIGDTSVKPKKILEINNGSQFSISTKGNYLVVCSTFYIHLLNLDNLLSSPRPYKSEFLVTSVSFITPLLQKNSNLITIAFGTTIGRLNYITYTPSNVLNNNNNDNENEKKQQHHKKESLLFSSYFHWHSTPLVSMEASTDGTLLFTGGYENSVVMWSIATNRKKVLPRLGGSIASISIDPTLKYLAVGLSTNKIQILQISDQSLIKSILGLQQSASIQQHQQQISTKSIQIDPRSKNLAISGSMDGFIQFYDLKNNRVDDEIQVSPPKNTLVSTKKTKGVFLKSAQDISLFTVNKTIVEPIEFHKNLPVFVSFESCIDQDPLVEADKAVKDQILKFWDTTSNSSSYECNFSITCPHATPITSMCFHPTSSILLTTSEADFKLWKKQSMESVDSITKIQKSYWTCVNQGTYKDLKSTSCSFSSDGSIFAIGFENLVTLWKSSNATLLEVITYPSDHIVSSVSFVPNSSYLLVNYKNKCAVLWSLESLAPVRIYNFIVSSIAVNDSYYAISASQEKNEIFNRLLIFSNKDAALVSDIIVPGSNSLVQIMFSKEKDHDCIYGFTSTGLIIGYSTCQDQSSKKRVLDEEQEQEQQEEGSITSYLGSSNKKPKKESKSNTNASQTSNIYKITTPSQIFNAASHIIPGVQNVYQKYMDSMLEDSKTTSTTTNTTDSSEQIENNNNTNNSDNVNDNNKQQKQQKAKKNQSTFKKEKQNTTTTEEKFSSMKNFFDTLEEVKPVAAATAEKEKQKPKTTTATTPSKTKKK